MTRAAKQISPQVRRARQSATPAPSDDEARIGLACEIMAIKKTGGWVYLDRVVGLPGVAATVSELRARLLAEGWTVEETRYSPDYQLIYECLLTVLPAVTLKAYLARLLRERAERKAAADALGAFKRRNNGVSTFVPAADLAGLPGLPEDVAGARAWAKRQGYIAGAGAEAGMLPPAALVEWIRRAEQSATREAKMASCIAEFEAFLDAEAALAAERGHPVAPEPWALMAVLSRIALACLAGKGVRLSADQTATLFNHLEDRRAA
ncbi:hypothetical protein ABE438_14630 [Bosea sp. TWI1241]|uniref:hypothetical protein n=1 Tax=Bosea sp. TWI1241 TaxID=3148904 RepID=UPI003208616F